MIRELSAVDLAAWRADELRPAPLLVDVREPWEWQIARIPGARLIPLGQLSSEIGSLDPARDTVIYCKSGVRSMHAACELEEAGFRKLANLTGGILRWSQDVDPAVQRY